MMCVSRLGQCEGGASHWRRVTSVRVTDVRTDCIGFDVYVAGGGVPAASSMGRRRRLNGLAADLKTVRSSATSCDNLQIIRLINCKTYYNAT